MKVKTSPQEIYRLIVLSKDQKAIVKRFGGWPDQSLTRDVLAKLLAGPVSEHEQGAEEMLDSGWMVKRGQLLVPAVPVFETLPLAEYMQQRDGLQVSCRRLTQFAAHLARSWSQRGRNLPAWERVGHSVLLGFLLWGCGEHILLERLQSDTAALLVLDPETADIAWNSVGSISPQTALARLLGGPFPQSVDVDDLLRLKEVTDAVASLDSNREIIPYGDSIHVMQRLSGLQILGGRSYGTKIYRLTWPTVTYEHLKLMEDDLALSTRALATLIDDMLAAIQWNELPGYYRQSDLSLAAYSLVTGYLKNLWEEAGVLPPQVVPALGDMSVPRPATMFDSSMQLQIDNCRGPSAADMSDRAHINAAQQLLERRKGK